MLFSGHEGVSKSYSEVLPGFPVIPAKQKFSLSLSKITPLPTMGLSSKEINPPNCFLFFTSQVFPLSSCNPLNFTKFLGKEEQV